MSDTDAVACIASASWESRSVAESLLETIVEWAIGDRLNSRPLQRLTYANGNTPNYWRRGKAIQAER